jgi:hypothetical protein
MTHFLLWLNTRDWKATWDIWAHIAQILVVIAGLSYFVFKVMFQKEFQRLSCEVNAKLLGMKDNKEGFDLRLMSWGDGAGVPTSGTNLVMLGIDNTGLLHIRIFDADGHLVTDAEETKLPGTQVGVIATLKQQLADLLPPHTLTSAEKAQLLSEVTSIIGQIHKVYVEFECVISNAATVRIDLDDVKLEIIEPQQRGVSLEENLQAGCETKFSVDAQSTIRLRKAEALLEGFSFLTIRFSFVARMTSDRYVVVRSFRSCKVNGVDQLV